MRLRIYPVLILVICASIFIGMHLEFTAKDIIRYFVNLPSQFITLGTGISVLLIVMGPMTMLLVPHLKEAIYKNEAPENPDENDRRRLMWGSLSHGLVSGGAAGTLIGLLGVLYIGGDNITEIKRMVSISSICLLYGLIGSSIVLLVHRVYRKMAGDIGSGDNYLRNGELMAVIATMIAAGAVVLFYYVQR